MPHTQPTPPGGNPDTGPGGLSSGLVRVVGFTVGGLALIALADVAPDAAVGLALVLALGVVISHSGELQTLAGAFATATGHPGG